MHHMTKTLLWEKMYFDQLNSESSEIEMNSTNFTARVAFSKPEFSGLATLNLAKM